MKFYTVKVQLNNDGTELKDMRSFETLDEALVQFHTSMSGNIGKCKSLLMMIINSSGGIHKNETWTAQTVEAVTAE